MTDVNKNIDELNAKIAKLEARIIELKSNLSENALMIVSLRDRVFDLEAKVTRLAAKGGKR